MFQVQKSYFRKQIRITNLFEYLKNYNSELWKRIQFICFPKKYKKRKREHRNDWWKKLFAM